MADRGGTELEDIQEWSRLYATLQGVQGSLMNGNDIEPTHNRTPADTLPDEGDGQDLTLHGEAAGTGDAKTTTFLSFPMRRAKYACRYMTGRRPTGQAIAK